MIDLVLDGARQQPGRFDLNLFVFESFGVYDHGLRPLYIARNIRKA